MPKGKRKAGGGKASSSKQKKVAKMDNTPNSPSPSDGNNSPEADSAAQKALNNAVILSKLLRYVSTQDMLKLRLINKAFADCATSMLRRRKDLHLLFGFRYEEKFFIRQYPGDDFSDVECYDDEKESSSKKIVKLSELTQLIGAPGSKFPCSSFQFNGILNLQQSDLMDFLSKFGQQIIDLHLNFEFEDIPKEEKFVWTEEQMKILGEILLHKIPMVKILTLEAEGLSGDPKDYCGYNIFPQIEGQDKVSLPNLKKLVVIGDFKGFSCLLQAAVNLKKLPGLELGQIDAVLEAGKLHCVTSLNPAFDPYEKAIDLYEKIANAAPCLTKLHINLFHMGRSKNIELRSRIAKVLSAILESSKASMKMLLICMEGLVFHEVKWPSEMPKMKELRLYRNFRDEKGWFMDRTEGHPIPEPKIKFRPGFLPQTFPNLEFFKVESETEAGGILEKFLLSGDMGKNYDVCLPKVKLFTITHRVPKAVGDKMPRLMPNLEKLYGLQLIMFPREWSRFMWKFPKLQTAYLDIQIGEACLHGYDLFPHLDSFFTGLSEEMVIKLQKADQFRKMAKQVDKIKRTHPSILDCKELKEITLKFSKDYYDEESGGYRFFTKVTGEFCLKLMPHLKFKAGADMDKYTEDILEMMESYKEAVDEALEPIGSYILPLKDPKPDSV